MNKKKEILSKYLPEGTVEQVLELMEEDPCHLKIVAGRRTKHGDFKRFTDGRMQITINNDLNPYRFLITLLHEIAHLKTFRTSGRVKPHGEAWRRNFQKLMLPFLRPDIWPSELLSLLAGHMIKPRASTDSDIALSSALQNMIPIQGNHWLGKFLIKAFFLTETSFSSSKAKEEPGTLALSCTRTKNTSFTPMRRWN